MPRTAWRTRSSAPRDVIPTCEHTFVRWDHLSIDHDEAATLPGYREPAHVRRFDVPEAMDTRFYEVRAKSVLNRVPERSRMPFRWTINPYRGCSHACVYCLDGDTQILMADGSSRALRSLQAGDAIVGTVAEDGVRRAVPTGVQAHWSTVRDAFRVTLRDGTALTAGGDHRFLTADGWRYVQPGPDGESARPALQVGHALVGLDDTRERCEAQEDLAVVSIAPAGKGQQLFDITTGTGDFIADGVVSHNCFARPTHTFLGFNPGRDFEREIVVKVNAPEVARAEMSRPRWRREHVAMGTNTDPYQWVESKYRLMPGLWEALGDSATPSSVLTKSPLLLRDADLMVRAAERAPVYADLSIPTWDERAWRQTEPHTPNPRARMEAVAELNRRGIPTGVLVAPLMPGVNDAPAQLEPLLAAAAAAGAVQIGGIGLHLRGETRDVFMDWLRSCRPDLVEYYEELYGAGDYLPTYERRRLAQLIRSESRDPAPGLDAVEGTERFRAMRAARAARPHDAGGGVAAAEQTTLF